MSEFAEKIRKVRESRFIDDKYHRYTNAIQLNGYLFNKPIARVLPDGKEIRTFYVIQVHVGCYKFYPCQTFAKSVIAQLDEIKTSCFLNVLGRLVYNNNSRYSLQIEEIAISHELTDEPLDEPYVPKSKREGENND